MSDYYGFFARGEAGNLILGPDHPVMVRYFGGDIRVTRLIGNGYSSQGVSVCEVAYPQVITTDFPPMVFGVPNPYFTGGGIGRFSHVGQPGSWTGFRVVFITSLFYRVGKFQYGYSAAIGQHTGWSYRVCGFDAPPSKDRFGLRLWAADGKLVFDSGWAIAPFRGLLKNWQQAGGGYYAPLAYWGDSFFGSTYIDDADRYGVYHHSWGVADGQLGVLISQLCTMVVLADTGERDSRIKTIPMIGFDGLDRTNLVCTLAYGTIQHAGTAGPALSNFGLLTADFSKT